MISGSSWNAAPNFQQNGIKLLSMLLPDTLHDAIPHTPRASSRKWTKEEDDLLRYAVVKQGGEHNWKRIAGVHMAGTGRSDVQCLHRWKKVKANMYLGAR